MDSKKFTKIYIVVISVITVLAIIFGAYKVGSRFVNFGGSKNAISDEQSINCDSFSKIDIDIDVSDVNITVGEGYSVSYECDSTANSGIVPQIKVDGDTLLIEQKMKSVVMSGFNSNNCEINITVPKDAKLELIKDHSDVGDITISGKNNMLEVATIDITSGVGEILIEDVASTDITCKSDVGDINLEKISADNVTLKSDVGEIKVTDSTLNKAKCNSSVGDVTFDNVHTAEGGDPDLDLNADVGDVKINK